MSSIYHFISLAANMASIIIALFGLYFVYKNWMIWKEVGMEIIKARAFLNKEFLERSWLYVVAAGGLITLRRIYRYFELTTDILSGEVISEVIKVLFDITGLIVIFLLVLMAYQWYKLLHSSF